MDRPCSAACRACRYGTGTGRPIVQRTCSGRTPSSLPEVCMAGPVLGWYITLHTCHFAGDGNFLFSASKVFSSDKLIVGVNTDPSR